VAKQKLLMAQMRSLEADISELEKAATVSQQASDDLDSFMQELSVTLQKEKINRKKRLLNDFSMDYDRLCSLGKLVKPALSGLSDTSNFTENQLKNISQFEQALKKKKSDTDNDTRDRTAEKRQQIHEQMKNMAKTSRHTSPSVKSSLPRDSKSSTEISPSSSPNQLSDNDQLASDYDRSFNVPFPTDYKEEHSSTHQPSILSGVAKAMEKQKKEELRRKERELADDDEDDNTNTKVKKKKKKKTGFDQDHENYDSWAPPEGQTGDGKTYLNEKFGY